MPLWGGSVSENELATGKAELNIENLRFEIQWCLKAVLHLNFPII